MRLYLSKLLCPTSHKLVPRDATRKMVDAAAAAMSPSERPTKEWVSVREKHRIRYCAMIDATD